MALTDKKCIPCEGGIAPYDETQVRALLAQVPGWFVNRGRLCKEFRFGNFAENMKFLNKVAELAEQEGHHPDFCVHYNIANFEIWTHALGGLSENDFILAAKINGIAE